ncbi:MAG: hypothetical protein ACOCUS_05425 [Polyangiales bacterium]
MNAPLPFVGLGSVEALRAESGDTPLAVVRRDDEGRLYRWRPESRERPDGVHTVRPDSVDEGDPGRWTLVQNITLARSGAVVVEGVPLSGERAIVAIHDGWQPIGVTDSGDGPTLWLARMLVDGEV